MCDSRDSSGLESCSVPNSPISTFYIRVHAYESHSSGNLDITGSNLLSVSVTGSLDQTSAASTALGTGKFTFTETIQEQKLHKEIWYMGSFYNFWNNTIIFLSERQHYVTFHPLGILGYHWLLMFTFLISFLFTFLFIWNVAGDLKLKFRFEIGRFYEVFLKNV